MKRKLSLPPLIAVVLLLLFARVAAAALPSVAVSLSATEFRAGDTLTVGIQVANPDGNPGADFYVGVVLADALTVVFFQAGGGVSPPITLTDIARFVPFQPAPPGYTLSTPVFFRYTFPAAGIAPGTYRFFAALARPRGLLDGRVDPGDVLALDVKPLVFSPNNTFLPFWRKPFDGEFRLTNFFDHNLPFEFVDTNGFLVTSWGERTTGIDGHSGYDFHMPEGTPILAVADGRVTIAGADTPRFCPPLNGTVSGLSVTIRHTAPNGESIRSLYHHFSRVDVRVGDSVVEGQQIGLSGNTGCSTGPHLHLEARRDNTSGQSVPFDPFGWESPDADPWALYPGGARSVWLWKAGQAPEIFKERRLGPNPDSGDTAAVAITAVRIMGWQDALRPNNEFVELTLDPRFASSGIVDLTGFRIRNNRGTSFSFPAGFVIRADRPVRVFSGAGTNTETELFWGSREPVWDDVDNCAHLVRPSGSNMYRLAYSSGCN